MFQIIQNQGKKLMLTEFLTTLKWVYWRQLIWVYFNHSYFWFLLADRKRFFLNINQFLLLRIKKETQSLIFHIN